MVPVVPHRGDLGDLGDRRLEVAVGSKIPTILWGQKPDRRGVSRGDREVLLFFHVCYGDLCWAYNTLYLTINHSKCCIEIFRFAELTGCTTSGSGKTGEPARLQLGMFFGWAVQPPRYNHDQMSLMEI